MMRFIWTSWLFLLLAGPFTWLGTQGVHVYLYAYSASGFICGAFLFQAVLKGRESCWLKIQGLLFAISGTMTTVVQFAFDLLSSSPLMPETLLAASIYRVLLVVSGACCSVTGLFAAKCAEEQRLHKMGALLVSPWRDGRIGAFAFFLFVLGFLRLGIFVLVDLPGLVSIEMLPSFFSLAGFVIFLAAAACLFAGKRKRQNIVFMPGSDLLFVCILAFSSGQIAWALCSHCYGIRGHILSIAPVLGILALIVELAFALFILALHRKEALRFFDQQGAETGAEMDVQPSTVECFANLYSLAPRELQALEMLLAGKTSAQAAELMGVRPSTVRSYLQRVYSKAGVKGSEELLAMLNRDEQKFFVTETKGNHKLAEAPQSCVDSIDVNNFGPTPVMFLYVTQCMLVMLFLLPPLVSSSLAFWHLGHATFVGFGLGVLAFTALSLSASLISQELNLEKTVLSAKATGRVFCIAAVILLLVRWKYSDIASTFNIGLTLLLVAIPSACFSFVACFPFSFAWNNEARLDTALSRPVLVTFVVSLLAACVASGSQTVWMISTLLALVVAFVLTFLVGGCVSCGAERSAFVPLSLDSALAAFLASSGLAFVISEQWHGTQEPFLVAVQLCYLAVIGILMVVKERTNLWGQRLTCSFLCAIGLALALRTTPTLALAICLMLGALLRVAVQKSASSQFSLFVFLGVGTGFSLGRLLVDRWGELMKLGFEQFAEYDVSFVTLATPSFFVVFLLSSAIAFAWLLWNERFQIESWEMPEQGECVRHYFMSRGLSELESDLAVRLVRGETTRQIASSLNYSVSRIGSIRSLIYKKLAVRNRAELILILEKANVTACGQGEIKSV